MRGTHTVNVERCQHRIVPYRHRRPFFHILMGGVFEFEFGGVKKKKVQYLLYAAYRTGLHTAKSCQGCITHTYMTYKQRYRRTISYVLSEISVLGGREKGTRG